MDQSDPECKLSVSQAVEAGILIDVSDAAKAAGLRSRAFVCATFWEKGLGRSDKELMSILEMFAGFYNFVFDYNHFGPMHPMGCPDLSRNHFEGYCTGILEPNPEFGLVFIVTGYRSQGRLRVVRTTGDDGVYGQ